MKMIEDDIIPNEFDVVPLEQKYLKDLTTFGAERFTDVTQRRRLFEWLTKSYPLSSRNTRYFLLLHQNKVIGMHDHMPLKFYVSGIESMGYLGHDDMLSLYYK